MKVGLIGTHGTGKTILAHELVAGLKKEGVRAGFLGEIASECKLPINEDETQEAGKWIFHTQCKREIEEEDRYEVLICDRSILDSYVYYHNLFGKNKGIEETIKEEIKKYNLLFRVPITPGYLKEDGIRSTDPKFQKEIDKEFDYLSKKLSIKYHTTNNLNEMLQIILDNKPMPILYFSKKQAEIIDRASNQSRGKIKIQPFSQKQADIIFREMKK